MTENLKNQEELEVEQDRMEQCSTCGTVLHEKEVIQCFRCDAKEIDGPVRLIQNKNNYVMLWQRIANSGIVEFHDTELKHVLKASWNPKYTKTTIIEGWIVKVQGVQN